MRWGVGGNGKNKAEENSSGSHSQLKDTAMLGGVSQMSMGGTGGRTVRDKIEGNLLKAWGWKLLSPPAVRSISDRVEETLASQV